MLHYEVCCGSDGGREHDAGAGIEASEQDDQGIKRAERL